MLPKSNQFTQISPQFRPNLIKFAQIYSIVHKIFAPATPLGESFGPILPE